MKDYIEKRVIELANYIISSGSTVRHAAHEFNISKSTVHKDVTERLAYLNHALFEEVRSVLKNNKDERHIRGGLATKEKYQKIREDERIIG